MGQNEELKRVRKVIAGTVLEFTRQHQQFRLDDLERYVGARLPITPGSPGRILRDLRLRGQIDYRVLDRSKSLYEVTA